MEVFGSFCEEHLDINLSKFKDEKYYYLYNLISFCLYKAKLNNNDYMRYCEQSKYISRISSVDKLIAKNRNKMKTRSNKSIPKKIHFTRQRKKMIPKTKQYKKPKKERLTNVTLPKKKTILTTTDEKPIKNTRRVTKKIWSEVFTERRKSRRLSNLPPLDIKLEIKNEDISESFDTISYGILRNNVPFVEVKREVDDTESGYMEEEENVYPVMNSSFDPNELHTTINTQYNKSNELQNIHIEKCDNTLNREWPDSTSNEIKPNVFLQSIDLNNRKHNYMHMNNSNIENTAILKSKLNINLTASENGFKETNKTNNIEILKSTNIRKKNTMNCENNFDQANDSNIRAMEISKKAPKITTDSILNNGYINLQHKNNLNNDNNLQSFKPIILKCWSCNVSEEETKINETKKELTYSEVTQMEVETLKKEDEDIMETERQFSPTDCTMDKNDYFKMTPKEKKLYREKFNFMTALGLFSKEEIKKRNIKQECEKSTIPQKDPLYTKMLCTESERPYYRTSSEKIRHSYFLEYVDKTSTNYKCQKHIAIPILIPERTSGSSFHSQRACTLKCSQCHGKFGSLDTPYHIAQIKNPDKQKACLENVSHLIGPNSCLCSSCFKSIEKRSYKNDIKTPCMITSCTNKAYHLFKSPVMKKIKSLIEKEGLSFKCWNNTTMLTVNICNQHYNKILNVSKCQFCGNLSVIKYELLKAECHAFQIVLDKDTIPVIINKELLVCKPCKVYFLWRICKKSFNKNIDFMQLRTTVLTRICKFNRIQVPAHLSKTKDIETLEKEFSINIPNYSSQTTIKSPLKSITSKLMSTSEQTQPLTNKNVPLRPVISVKNNQILSLKPIQSNLNKSTGLVMVSSLQPIKNKNQPNKRSSSDNILCDKRSNDGQLPTLISNKFVQPPETTNQIRKPTNVSFLKAVNISKSKTTSIIKSDQSKQPVLKKTLPSMNSSKCHDTDGLHIQKIRLNKSTLRLFKNLQFPYYNSQELLNHLLILEKYRMQGVLKIVNDNSEYNEAENNYYHTPTIIKPLANSYRFQHLPKTVIMRGSSEMIKNSNKLQATNSPLIVTPVRKDELIKKIYGNKSKTVIRKCFFGQNTGPPPLIIPVTSALKCKQIPQSFINNSNKLLSLNKNKINNNLRMKQPVVMLSKNSIASSTTSASIVKDSNKNVQEKCTVVSLPKNSTASSNITPSITKSNAPKYMKFLSDKGIVVKRVYPSNNTFIVSNSIKNGINAKMTKTFSPRLKSSSINIEKISSNVVIPTVRLDNTKVLTVQPLRSTMSNGSKFIHDKKVKP